MRKVWVIVANQSEAKIFCAQEGNKLVELTTFQHDEGHQSRQDLVSDKKGSHRGLFGSDGLEERTSVKTKEASIFAHQIATYVEKHIHHHEVERLYVIAKPPFVSTLRSAFTPSAAKLIQDEVHKDIVHATAQEVREYLPPVL